jgi:electron transfer flavoprotein beta subunit
MKIAVIVKHTVNVRSVRIDPESGTPSFDGKPGLDRPDLHVISDAVGLKESSKGHVTVFGVGPVAMRDDLVTALATGVDEAVHIVHEGESDSLFVARSLADVLREGQFDVIITGKLSEDYGTGQVGMQVAELLAIPHLSGVIKADGSGGNLEVSYELDGFPDDIIAPTPILLVLGAREGEPARHSSLRGMMTARKKAIVEQSPSGDATSALEWTAPMAARRGGDRIVVREDDPAEAARKLAEWLKEHRLAG